MDQSPHNMDVSFSGTPTFVDVSRFHFVKTKITQSGPQFDTSKSPVKLYRSS
jgi:hypothetical protein